MDPVIIAVTGKGGVGKTSIAALLVKQLARAHPRARILAIDADPAVGLATALGVQPLKTLDDIRLAFVKQVDEGNHKEALELLSEARYEITEALIETDEVVFLAIGRPEGAGCYCKVNAYLKDIISMLADDFDFVVIDGEAGIEQVNRRVLEKITHLLLVSDTSKKGIHVVNEIFNVAKRATNYTWAGLVLNRLSDEGALQSIDVDDVHLAAVIKEDSSVGRLDMQGRSLLELPCSSEAVLGVQRTLKAMQLV